MQKSPREEPERWFAQSEQDLTSAKVLADNERYDAACYFFQQASEKAIKAFIYLQGAREVLGHSVTTLLRSGGRYDPSLAALIEEVSGLDLFYISARYPNGLPDDIPARVFNHSEAERAQAMAEKVMLAVKSRIKPKS